MTSDEIDDYAERLASGAVDTVGAEEAPGTLLQALLMVMLKHHSLDAAVICLEQTVWDLRADLSASLKPEGLTH